MISRDFIINSLFIILILASGAIAAVYTGVCITRGKVMGDIGENPISIKEWEKLIDQDSQLKSEETIQARNPRTGEILYLKRALWINPETGSEVIFFYRCGIISIYTDKLDNTTIAKAKKLAVLLKARVLSSKK
jgi:hypothetical protein